MPHIAPDIDYDSEKLVHPSYQYQQYLPLNSQQNVILDNTGGQLTQFELPPQAVYNLSKSYIEFDFVPPAATDTNFNWFHCNGFLFWNILQLQPRGGVYLANIYQLSTYLNMVSRQCYKLQDFLSWDRPKE
jgi:hypothetical protein